MAQSGELHLWRAVLVTGLSDVAQGRDDTWLGSPDFMRVCHFALVDPEAVLRAYRPERFDRLSKVA